MSFHSQVLKQGVYKVLTAVPDNICRASQWLMMPWEYTVLAEISSTEQNQYLFLPLWGTNILRFMYMLGGGSRLTEYRAWPPEIRAPCFPSDVLEACRYRII